MAKRDKFQLIGAKMKSLNLPKSKRKYLVWRTITNIITRKLHTRNIDRFIFSHKFSKHNNIANWGE